VHKQYTLEYYIIVPRVLLKVPRLFFFFFFFFSIFFFFFFFFSLDLVPKHTHTPQALFSFCEWMMMPIFCSCIRMSKVGGNMKCVTSLAYLKLTRGEDAAWLRAQVHSKD